MAVKDRSVECTVTLTTTNTRKLHLPPEIGERIPLAPLWRLVPSLAPCLMSLSPQTSWPWTPVLVWSWAPGQKSTVWLTWPRWTWCVVIIDALVSSMEFDIAVQFLTIEKVFFWFWFDSFCFVFVLFFFFFFCVGGF